MLLYNFFRYELTGDQQGKSSPFSLCDGPGHLMIGGEGFVRLVPFYSIYYSDVRHKSQPLTVIEDGKACFSGALVILCHEQTRRREYLFISFNKLYRILQTA